jgi:hypothetical protein
MQVLVLAVQNAVDYSMLGAATSGVTMFRGIGGSLGTAIFGTIFSNRLSSQLRGVVHGPLAGQIGHGARLTGSQVAHLPTPARALYQHAYVQSLRPVFVLASGVAAVGFLLSLRLQERPLRETAATSTGLEDTLAAPRGANSLAEIERSLTRVTTAEQRTRFRQRVAERAGVGLSPGATWALVRIDEHGFARALELAGQDRVPPERIAEVSAELRACGLLTGDRDAPQLTPSGHDYTERLVGARRTLLAEALADGSADRQPEVMELLRRLARELSGEPPRRPAAPIAT